MAEKKNQHFVPKVHLKGFAVDEQKKQINIWLPRADKVVLSASIKDQCSRSYFYGKDLRIENFLNTPEGKFGEIARRLEETQIPTQTELSDLLFLWLLQHIRAERALTEQLLMMAVMREKVSLGQEGNEKLEEFLGPKMGVPEAMEMALDNAKYYYSSIEDLRCVLLVNNSRTGFVMSDNPAVSSNKLVLKRFMKYRNWGLGGAGLYVFLPLTPSLGFLAYDRHVYELNRRKNLTCDVSEKDVTALNQLIYLFCNNVIVLPPSDCPDKIVTTLKQVTDSKPASTMRVNLAVEDEEQDHVGSKRFSVASDEEFANSKTGGLIHLESVPPIVPQHLPKLRIRQRPKFHDTKSGAGLKRFGGLNSYKWD